MEECINLQSSQIKIFLNWKNSQILLSLVWQTVYELSHDCHNHWRISQLVNHKKFCINGNKASSTVKMIFVIGFKWFTIDSNIATIKDLS